MEKDEEQPIQNTDQDAKAQNVSPKYSNVTQSSFHQFANYNWCLRIAFYAIFVLFGQSAAILLGKLYYNKGGNSKWMVTFAQLAGFPILIPYYLSSPPEVSSPKSSRQNPPSGSALLLGYVASGAFLAANTMLYSIGLLYLPVSTFAFLCSFQLAFNALFSFLLQSKKSKLFAINSLVLHAMSSIFPVIQSDSTNKEVLQNGTYAVGFVCTIVASAGHGLMLSLLQLSFKKIIQTVTHSVVLEIIINQSIAATCVALVGLFGSGEWKQITTEMDEFGLGKWSYIMTLSKAAIASQVFAIGAVGLVFEVSSLFSNAVKVISLPLIPVLAVFFLHEKLDGIKAFSMILAIWSFITYVCHYCSDVSKFKKKLGRKVSKITLLKDAGDELKL